MSSIVKPANHPVAGKRGFFLRSSSIQKIKCSATYPFRIAGSKLSRHAIKQLLEDLIIKARLLSQKALLFLYVTTFRILGVIRPLSPSLSAADNDCDKSIVIEKELTFAERILTRTIKLRIHKSKRQNSKQTENEAVLTSSIEKEPANSTRLAINIATSKLLLTEKPAPRRPQLILVLCVHASAILIYLQLVILTIALNTAPLPAGLLFMIFNVLFIGCVATKVFLIENQQKKSSKQINVSTNDDSKTGRQDSASIHDGISNRHRRIKIRNSIAVDLNSKTLSKIKLL